MGSENPVQIDPGSFCRALYPRLVGALSLSCANRDDAEELAQETLSRVLEHWEHVRQLDDPEAWAFRTGFNLTNSWWRRRAVARRVEERLRRRRVKALTHQAIDTLRHAGLTDLEGDDDE